MISAISKLSDNRSGPFLLNELFVGAIIVLVLPWPWSAEIREFAAGAVDEAHVSRIFTVTFLLWFVGSTASRLGRALLNWAEWRRIATVGPRGWLERNVLSSLIFSRRTGSADHRVLDGLAQIFIEAKTGVAPKYFSIDERVAIDSAVLDEVSFEREARPFQLAAQFSGAMVIGVLVWTIVSLLNRKPLYLPGGVVGLVVQLHVYKSCSWNITMAEATSKARFVLEYATGRQEAVESLINSLAEACGRRAVGSLPEGDAPALASVSGGAGN